MQEANDESVTSSQGSLGQLEAESTEIIYSEILKRPSKDVDDETSTSKNSGLKGSLDKLSADGNATAEKNPVSGELVVKDSSEDEEPQTTALPPKPPHTLPKDFIEYNDQPVYENNDQPVYENSDYTPPEAPPAAENVHETVEDKYDWNSGSPKPKQKFDAKKLFKRDKLSSYESIGLEEICPTGRSTESIKEAVKAAKRAKESCSSERCPKIKIVFGTSVGIALGMFCFLILYLFFSRHVLTCIVLAIITGLVISVVLGFLDARRLKCIILLIFPSICSSGAKLALWILLTYFLVSGPLCNFIQNVRITAMTRGCLMEPRNNTADVATIAKRKTDPQTDPRTQYFIDNIEQFENLTNELGRYLNETLTVDRDNNGGSLTTGLICRRELFKARNTCSLAFESLYKNCTTTLKRWGLHGRCSEFILRSSACRHLSDSFIRTTCGSINSAQLLPLKNMTVLLQKKPTPTVKPSYSTENHTDEDNTTFAFTAAEDDDITEASDTKSCEFMVIAEMLLPLLILVVLFEAYRYHKHYLVYNEFDNCYLTLHFGSIESTRRASGATDGLIPLKKGELQNNVQPTSCRLSQAEMQYVLKYLIIFLVYAIFALLLLLGDLFFYRAVTSEEPRLDTNPNRTLSGRCDAQLKNPDEIHTIIISILLGLLLLLIILQAYVLRLRRYITARFYRTRERKRVTYLYYKLLEERKAFYKSTIDKINNVSEENDVLNRLDSVLVLAHHFPLFGKVVQFLGLSLKRCMVCGTGLNRKYVTCDTEECGAVYCRTCFWDLESNCLGCMSSSKMSSPSWGSAGETTAGKNNDYVLQL